MNTADLAEAVANGHGLTKTDARKIKDTPAREGRNPSTGATIQIAAARKLTFAPAKAVKDKINA